MIYVFPHPFISMSEVSKAVDFSGFGHVETLTWGRFGSTVPFDFDVSGLPSDFVLFSWLVVRSVECLVSVLLMPSCFPDIWF